jgi:hypothetical protein
MNEPHRGTECANHSGVAAGEVCYVCGKPVCADCSVRVGDRVVCDDPDHKIILGAWELVFRSNSEFEADMIIRNLEFEKLELRRFSSRVHKHIVGEDPHDFVNVFVLRNEQPRAMQILTALGLPGVNQINQEPH